jgi:TonB family protein
MTARLKALVAIGTLALVVTTTNRELAAQASSLVTQAGSLAAARELYVSAAYDESLKMLEALLAGSPTREERQSIGLYRILCLIAVGRAGEAEQAIESLITQDPLYRPALDDLSPRMRTAITDARKRLLPVVIQQRYREAKTAYDRQEFATAASAFGVVLEVLADPGIADAAAQPPLSDLRTLATGFHDLSVKAAAPPPPPAPLPAPAPVVVVAAPPAAPARDFRRVYTSEDADVILPIAVKQALPPFAGRLGTPATGVIEVLINAMGTVEKATLLAPIDPRYDQQLVSAAQRWQYKPATVEGVPVKFRKSVQVNLQGAPR